jgi:hypothetical protein
MTRRLIISDELQVDKLRVTHLRITSADETSDKGLGGPSVNK